MAAKTIAPDALDRLVLLLVSGATEAAARAAAPQLGIPEHRTRKALDEARRRITLAADYHRDREIGTAIVRLNDLYRRALSIQDAKTALAAQRELNRLMSLYTPPLVATVTGPGSTGEADAEAAREHLEALGLGGETLAELARRAVARIIELETNARG